MSKCLACKEELVGTPLIVLDNMPASAQDIPDAEQVKNDRGIKLHLYQCSHCGLVNLIVNQLHIIVMLLGLADIPQLCMT